MTDFKELSVAIPAFNEEEGILLVIQNLTKNLPGAEIIVVNDGSDDLTEQNAIREGKKHKNVKIYSHIFNRGYGAALKTGMKNSTRKYIAWFDSDNEHKVSDLINIYDIIRSKKVACVISQRTNRSGTVIRGVGKWLIRMLARSLHINAGKDLNCGLRIFRRDIILNYVDVLPERYSASLTSTFLMVESGYPIEYYPITLLPRIGASKVKLKDGFFAINKVLHLIMLLAPMRIFYQSGFVSLLIGFIYSFHQAFSQHEGFPVAGLVLIFSGFLLCAMGLLADQISSIRMSQFVKPDSLTVKKHSDPE